jgi:hypothetical protein
MATDSDVSEASKADAMEVDNENEVVTEKQRLRLVSMPAASINYSERECADKERYSDQK